MRKRRPIFNNDGSSGDGFDVAHASGAPPPVRFAATELSRYFERISGHPFPVQLRPGVAANDVILVYAAKTHPP
ncbi:hypothetical protein ACFLSJ_03500 [Verrucomicrobiota bacterium]